MNARFASLALASIAMFLSACGPATPRCLVVRGVPTLAFPTAWSGETLVVADPQPPPPAAGARWLDDRNLKPQRSVTTSGH
jgi:hypothetical protein